MIPSNPSTDNGSQVNQMTCQFTTGFSEKKKQLCFQRPKLQEHLPLSNQEIRKLSSMKHRKHAWKTLIVCFWGPTVTFHGYMYIYIFLKLRIRSRYPLNGCGFVPYQPFHLRMWQSMLWLQSRCSQKSGNKVGSPQQLFALFFVQKNIFTKMVSWKLELDGERFDVFFCFPQLFSFVLPLFYWWIGLLKIRSVVPTLFLVMKQTSKFPKHSNVEKTRLGT